MELAADEEDQEDEDISAAPYEWVTAPGTAPSGIRGCRKSQDKPSEEVGSIRNFSDEKRKKIKNK